MESAVLAFDRTPALLTSVARRLCAAPAVSFFDDAGVVDASFAQGSAQAAVRPVYSLAGAELDLEKSQPPGQCRTLGLSVNVGSLSRCTFDLKPGSREQLCLQADCLRVRPQSYGVNLVGLLPARTENAAAGAKVR